MSQIKLILETVHSNLSSLSAICEDLELQGLSVMRYTGKLRGLEEWESYTTLVVGAYDATKGRITETICAIKFYDDQLMTIEFG